MTKNRLTDLNDHLFAQIERLSNEELTDDQVDREVRRGTAIVAASDQIIRIAAVQVKAAEIAMDARLDPTPWLPAIRPGAAVKIIGEGK